MFIGRIVDCVHTLACGREFSAECGGLAAGGGMGDEDVVGECADQAVAGFGQGCGDALVLGWEWGQDEQTAGVEGRKQLWLQVHSYDGAGGNPDDGLAATEQDAQALPFHDRVEAAYQNLALVAHLRDGIEGLQDDGAGALR